MPKVIPSLREKIIAQAKRHIVEDEAHDFSIRQLASDCGIAVGTLFNYFASKEELLACVMLEDWMKCVETMTAAAENATEPAVGFLAIEHTLRSFSAPFLPVWKRYDHFHPGDQHHQQLIEQLERPVAVLLESTGCTCSSVEQTVLAEMLLTASQREPGTINRLMPVLEKLIMAK